MKSKKNYSLSLDKFIDYCLYDKKNGYYMNSNPFGNKGDFITSPNISILFSELLPSLTKVLMALYFFSSFLINSSLKT